MASHFDLRSPLKIATVYSRFQRMVGGNIRQRLVQEYIRPRPGDRMLDIGCGPADLLDYVPESVEYVGFDLSQKYIDSARRRYGHRAQFECQRVRASNVEQFGQFDLVLAQGVVHHLDDSEATQLFRLAASALSKSGRLVTIDGCYLAGQSPVARRMLSWDRGKFVRWKDSYEQLARQTFPNVTIDVRHDLLRIPYTHIIMDCSQWSVANYDTDTNRKAA